MSIDHWRGLAAVFVILILAWAISENRRKPPWGLIVVALSLQAGLLALIRFVPQARTALSGVDQVVESLRVATYEGARFTFGYLAGGPQPFTVLDPPGAMVLALQVLPMIIVISALAALLWRWRILEFVCRGLGFLLERSLGLSGPVGLATAANIFLGMIEAPLTIRPYLATLSRSDMFVVLTGGMATVAGTVMAVYAVLLRPTLPDAALHIIAASLMAAPASVLLARLMIPQGAPSVASAGEVSVSAIYHSTIDAFSQGVEDGMRIFLSVIGMLVASIAVVSLANQLLAAAPDVGGAELTVERIFGWIFAPLAWIMGIPWAEAGHAGALMGAKVTLSEFVAYLQLAETPDDVIGARTRLILTYALCGFASFAGAAIMIGGLASICPERRGEIGELGVKSIVSGVLTTSLTGAMAGAFTGLA